MGLFEKKEIVFEMRGRKDDFKRVKAALREKGIKGVSSSVWQVRAERKNRPRYLYNPGKQGRCRSGLFYCAVRSSGLSAACA